MKKEEELQHKLTELVKETQAGHLVWDLQCKTTEYKDKAEKETERIDGANWIVDECFVSYHCEHRNSEFLMITYEKIYTKGTRKQSNNLIFLPPLGIRFFDLGRLAPYAVQASQILTYSVHMLWMTLMDELRRNPQHVTISVSQK